MTAEERTARSLILPAIIGLIASPGCMAPNRSQESQALETVGQVYETAGQLKNMPGLSLVGWGFKALSYAVDHDHKVRQQQQRAANVPAQPQSFSTPAPVVTTSRYPEVGAEPPEPAPSSIILPDRADPAGAWWILSRDDDRYPKQVTTPDEIIVKLRDTDAQPLDADFEVIVGARKIKLYDVPVGASIYIAGLSGQVHCLEVLEIIDETETVTIVAGPDGGPFATR